MNMATNIAGSRTFSSGLQALFTALAALLLFAQFTYTLTFDYVPTPIRHLIAGMMFVLHLVMALSVVFTVRKRWVFAIFLSVFCILLGWSVAGASNSSPFDYASAMRSLLPYFAVIWILSWPNLMSPRLILILSLLLLVIAAVVALLGTPLHYAGTVRAAIFTGGTDGIHSSAYAVGANILIVDQLRRGKYLRPDIAWLVIAISTAVIVAYEVRTILLMLLVYAGSCFLAQIKNQSLLKLVAVVFAFAVIFLAFVYLTLAEINLETIGNGRFGQYFERLEIIGNRDFFDFFFGTGLSSDLMVSSIWWWAAKVTHNDVLHIFIEQGFLGLIALFLFVFALYEATPREGLPIVAAFFVTSLVSVGFMSRPTLTCFVLFALAVAFLRREMVEQSRIAP